MTVDCLGQNAVLLHKLLGEASLCHSACWICTFNDYTVQQDRATYIHIKNKLVDLTTEWLPSCNQPEETVVIRGLLW